MSDVERFLADLEHPLKEGVLVLRDAILASGLPITEHIKWNAPSYVHDGEDRVTFRLQPRGRLQLIFHRGAKVRADAATFTFDDPTGLMTWPSRDRAVIDFPDVASATRHRSDVSILVDRWMRS